MELTSTTGSRFESPYGAAVQVMERGINLRQQSGSEEDTLVDKINVSQDGLLFTEALRGAQNAPDVRSEKVEALRASVTDGSYKINTRDLAFNLLRDEAFFSHL